MGLTYEPFFSFCNPTRCACESIIKGMSCKASVKKFKKGCKFYIITSGNQWLIWNSMDVNMLSQINAILSLTRGKHISKSLKDKSWKATGQEYASAVGEFIHYDEVKDAVKDKVGGMIDSASDTIQDAGDWVRDKLGF